MRNTGEHLVCLPRSILRLMGSQHFTLPKGKVDTEKKTGVPERLAGRGGGGGRGGGVRRGGGRLGGWGGAWFSSFFVTVP